MTVQQVILPQEAAITLWQAIINYAKVMGEIKAVDVVVHVEHFDPGRHNIAAKAEHNRLLKELSTQELALIERFRESTGWLPKRVTDGKSWELEVSPTQ